MSNKNSEWGLACEFSSPTQVHDAAIILRDAGYQKFECYTPFPVHGLDDAMGIKPSPLPWIVLLCGMTGLAIGIVLQIWGSTAGYSMIISGKPDGWGSFIAFVPVAFETTILASAFAAVFGMLALNGLPKFYSPMFTHESFKKVTDDKFFISVCSDDIKYSKNATKELLTKAGGTDVTEIHG